MAGKRSGYSQPVYVNYAQPVYAQPAYQSYSQPAYSSYSQPAYQSYSKPAYSSYSQPAYNDYRYAQPSYGYSKPAYNQGHGYGYQPAVVKKDYGLWENYYRIEVETFKKTVATDKENVWVIAYIDPSCGGCKRLSVQWEKLTTLETISVRKVKFGYVDISVEANKEIITQYTSGSVNLTPAVYVYG